MIIERERGEWPADYAALREQFRWNLPKRFNLGVDVARHASSDDPAIITTDGLRVRRMVTFGELDETSNRLANAFAALGLGYGDRIGLVLRQRPETAIAHLAIYKLGAIAVPLSVQFGVDALQSRLSDADVAAVIAEPEAVERVMAVGVPLVIDVDGGWDPLIRDGSPRFDAAATHPDTPALLIYTSGTTGPPKGALHGHGILAGHLPGVSLSHGFLPHAGDVFWTPADWAWIGGLFDVLMPALRFGRPVIAFNPGPFDPEQALSLIKNLEVRNLFLPPTALRMLRQASGPAVNVRSVATGGEPLNEDLLEWGRERFGVEINEFYGQTEANMIISSCSALWPIRPGWMGKAVPGHDVDIIDGEIAVRAADDPVVFLGYWKNSDATADKVRDGWLRTGDLGERTDDGSFRFIARADDVINSAGYRIGPGEVEACLVRHPAVAMVAVIGIPDSVRGQVVKAVIVPTPGTKVSAGLVSELRDFVKSRLAAYEYPREVEFVDSLPLTTTGKVQRRLLRERSAASPNAMTETTFAVE